MANEMTVTTDVNGLSSTIFSQIAPTIENALKGDALEYYSKMTEEEKKKKL